MPAFRYFRALAVLAVLALGPSVARAADFVLWWEKGFYPEEDKAVREMITVFEQTTGMKVELVQHSQSEGPDKAAAALVAGQLPDFIFGSFSADDFYDEWAYKDRLVELTSAIGPLLELFDQDAIEAATKHNARTGRPGLYALPIGRASNHIHVWRSLLAQAGFKLEDIPKEWEPFWAFWCDEVQPAVRKALGRDDIWATGLSMSAAASDTRDGVEQFMAAFGARWQSVDYRIGHVGPERRTRFVEALDAYTSLYKKGCTPPDSLNWANLDNNKAFLAQRIVMTTNTTLSIPNAMKQTRPEDYYKNTRTPEWPRTVEGQPLPIVSNGYYAILPKGGSHPAAGLEFVHFLVADMELARYLAAAHQRVLPPMRKLLDQPFWLDPGDPHLLRSAMQLLTQPKAPQDIGGENAWRVRQVYRERLWETAAHRVAAGEATPEAAVDAVLARLAEIWALPAPE